MRIIALSILLVFLGFSTIQAQDGDESGTSSSSPARTISMVKVADSIYMFQGKGGNIGVSYGNDGVLLIDSQFAPATPEIVDLIASLSDKPVQFLVNTHHHGDHTGGNANMTDNGAIVFAHDNARKRLVDVEKQKIYKAQEDEFKKLLAQLEDEGNRAKAAEKAKEGMQSNSDFDPSLFKFPVITFSDNMTFHYNGETIMVFHLHNAHTDGDALVYFTESNVLHTGDVFFNGRYPYIDINSGGTYDGYVEALSKILALIDDETQIIPGHGGVGSKEDVQKSYSMMKALKDRVAYYYVKNMSKEEILANKEITKEYDALGFGDGYISTEKFVELIYKLTAAKYGKISEKK
jgi:glyoxylase-like metal-dependent hydrolase (beta-lactamase superfamily II)